MGPAFPGALLYRLPDGEFVWRRGRKLNIEKVREIRALAAQGMPQRAIAGKFEACLATINEIVRNKIWREVAA
jgi:DNA invertase Pin-like site-specific DNA recombinase